MRACSLATNWSFRVGGRRTSLYILYVCPDRVLVSGVLRVGRVAVATPAGFGARPPLIRSPLSPSYPPVGLPSEVPFVVFGCLYKFLVDLKAAIRLRADQFAPPSSALLSLPRIFLLFYPLRSPLLSSNACTSSLLTSKLLSASVLISLPPPHPLSSLSLVFSCCFTL